MFVKLGQVLSTRTDLISPQAAAELSLLQDHVRPAPRDGIAEVLEEELDAPVSEVFRGVRLAAGRGGVDRPGVPGAAARRFARRREGAAPRHRRVGRASTSRCSRSSGSVVETRTSWGAEYRVDDLVDEFGARLREELDYRIEARNAARHRARPCPPTSRIRVPYVYEDLSTSRVLVMEWLDGVERARGRRGATCRVADRVKLADSLLRTFLEQMLQEGVFHADPHPGNVMLLADGQLALDRLRRRRPPRPGAAGRAARPHGRA